MRVRLHILLGGCLAILAACGGRSTDQEDNDIGGTELGSNATGAGGTGEDGDSAQGDDRLFMSSAYDDVEYTNIVATSTVVSADRTELIVTGTTIGENGALGDILIHIAPNPGPGTHACVDDQVYISTQQLCCPYRYDSRNSEPTAGATECTITIDETSTNGGRYIDGTFEGIIHDVNGGRFGVREGQFHVKLAD